MNKEIMEVKLISKNVLESLAYYSRFNQLYYTFLLFTTVDKETKKRTRPASVNQKTSFVRFLLSRLVSWSNLYDLDAFTSSYSSSFFFPIAKRPSSAPTTPAVARVAFSLVPVSGRIF